MQAKCVSQAARLPGRLSGTEVTIINNYYIRTKLTNMQKSNLLGKQRQLAQNKELSMSFKNTANLAHALTRERKQIQNDLQKISAGRLTINAMFETGKEQLEALKSMKKVAEPILTAEERASKVNKAEIKGTGFQMEMVSSEKGRVMIEKQRDSRRQRHIAAVSESHKFIDQFYDNFCERKNEIKERSRIFVAASDSEIDDIIAGLTDELLLENEITYVNAIWDKVSQHRSARNADSEQLRANLDQLKAFQQKGSTGFLNKLREDLINIAFLLEPQVDELLVEYRVKDEKRYELEHVELDKFHEEVVVSDQAKFENLYVVWKEAVVRFHKLKQSDAIKKFLDRMNSEEFVNPPSRVEIFDDLKEEQMTLFKQRMSVVKAIDTCPPTEFTKKFVEQQEEQLKQYNDESGIIFERLADKLAKDMENTNEDIDIAEFDLKDFLIKNDAQLEEGETFESIMEEQVQPTTVRRKLESKTLNTNAINYMDDSIYKMGEICTNVITFYKDFATRMDNNKQKLKLTEVNFQVALAQAGDALDEIVSNQEDELSVKVTEMKQAIHHVQLNERLQECFDLLDKIQRSYRNYNIDYIKILNAHPDTMNDFFDDYEADMGGSFQIYKEARREEIQEKLRVETENKQAKLQADALAKYEAEQAAEEAKRAQEEAKGGKAPPKAKAAPPKKGGKDAGLPDLEVEQLEVPKVTEFASEMGNKYIRERPLQEIIVKLMTPQEEEEEEKPEEGKEGEEEAAEASKVATPELKDVKGSAMSNKKNSRDANIMKSKDGKPMESQEASNTNLLEGEEEGEEEKKEEEPKFLANDYLEKAEMQPPKDPYGNDTMHPDLIVANEQLLKIVEDSLMKTLSWLLSEKINYGQKVQAEIKDLQDKSVEELDVNLRKQWPRKGRLEVEVFQERKAQISKHNKQYERHVRVCLEKYNQLQEEWALALETIGVEFKAFKDKHLKLKEMLPSGKNLAELQGMSRREKDANQVFEEKCQEFHDKLLDLGEFQLDNLVRQNADMLKNCRLFSSNDGDYAVAEVAWYKEQMDEIDNLLLESKEKKKSEISQVLDDMSALKQDPTADFQGEYSSSIQQLSAKEGLGKTFGQPRRLTQERMRAEMTKCEQAQKGVDQLIDQLEDLCEESINDEQTLATVGKTKGQTVSQRIRVALVQVIRSIRHYALHLGGFREETKELERITYTENRELIDIEEEEKEEDAKRQDEELEILGPIGFKNASEPYVRFPDAVVNIETMCKELCQKLYQGDNIKYLEGPDRIPAYLTIFLENMRKQAEGFKIQQVRQLRTSAQRLQDLCQEIPRCAYHYIRVRYTSLIEKKVQQEDAKFDSTKSEDVAKKQEHLRLFRPNLENPANKQATQELNQQELERSDAYIESIDDTQMELLEIEQDLSTQFYTVFLNNTRAMIRLFDALIYKEHFIQLPGDEIVEKKHKNIKHLMAMDANTDLSKRATRKFPGLGQPIFQVDFEKQFEAYRNTEGASDGHQSRASMRPESAAKSNAGGEGSEGTQKNEVACEVEVQNTLHHKAIVRARNDNYGVFKWRFQQSLDYIMSKFDEERKEEIRFQEYWQENLKEITVKHI